MILQSFVKTLVDELIAKFFYRFKSLFTPDDPSQFASQYQEIAGDRYATPKRSDPNVAASLVANEWMFNIAVSILALLLMFVIVKTVIGTGRSSPYVQVGVRISVGVGLLALNVELIFILFEFTDLFVQALAYSRGLVLGQKYANQSLVGYALLAGSAAFNPGFWLAKVIGGIFQLITVLVLAGSLYVREVILQAVIIFAPIMVVLWTVGPILDLPQVGTGIAARALFFPIPLMAFLTIIEILALGDSATQQAVNTAGPSTIGPLMRSFLILAAVVISAKLSIAGKVAVSALRKGAGAALVVGAGAAVGGTTMAKTVCASTFIPGKAGSILAGGMASSGTPSGVDGSTSQAPSGGQTLEDKKRQSTAGGDYYDEEHLFDGWTKRKSHLELIKGDSHQTAAEVHQQKLRHELTDDDPVTANDDPFIANGYANPGQNAFDVELKPTASPPPQVDEENWNPPEIKDETYRWMDVEGGPPEGVPEDRLPSKPENERQWEKSALHTSSRRDLTDTAQDKLNGDENAVRSGRFGLGQNNGVRGPNNDPRKSGDNNN